ncbi:MAG: NADH-quinone oxidoreductase subunit C [Nitrososphaerales archaeon]
MSNEELAELAARLGGSIASHPKSVDLIVSPDKVLEACKSVSSIPGLYHLSTITGLDLGEEIGILYQFWQGRRFVVVRTAVPKTNPKIQSVSGSLPSATLYEAEIQDLLGVSFEGNPYLGKRLLLPDNYPAEAPPPLRKEADPQKIRKMMELE